MKKTQRSRVKKPASLSFTPIGFAETPYKGKFGVPRQPGLALGTPGKIQLLNDPDLKTALKGLEEFSHLWVIFVFHAHGAIKWKPSIRPPRLGGNKKMGVLASRSPHRPNPIGLSVVKLEKIDWEAPHGALLHIRGHDLLDETPILDIKPYVTYADSVPDAISAWAEPEIVRTPVMLSATAESTLNELIEDERTTLKQMIDEVLGLDPRPAFQQRKYPLQDSESWGRAYGIDILGYDVKYEIQNAGFIVTRIIPADET